MKSLLALLPFLLCVQCTPVLGTNGYVSYFPGDLPLILTSPHGGYDETPNVSDRTSPCWDGQNCVLVNDTCPSDPTNCPIKVLRDAYTRELTVKLADHIEYLTGRRPHVIINELHRSKLDANREPIEACNGAPTCLTAYNEFHSFITQARATVTTDHGKGLLVDMHGHAHALQALEFGYSLSPYYLDKDDAYFAGPNRGYPLSWFTMANLVSSHADPAFFAEVLRGATSIGGLMSDAEFGGYICVPSPSRPNTQGLPYFQGGYDVQQHGSRYGGTVDAFQIEMPTSIRWATSESRDETHTNFAYDFSRAIVAFFNTHYFVINELANTTLADTSFGPGGSLTRVSATNVGLRGTTVRGSTLVDVSVARTRVTHSGLTNAVVHNSTVVASEATSLVAADSFLVDVSATSVSLDRVVLSQGDYTAGTITGATIIAAAAFTDVAFVHCSFVGAGSESQFVNVTHTNSVYRGGQVLVHSNSCTNTSNSQCMSSAPLE